MSVWDEGSRVAAAATDPDARRVRPQARPLTKLQRGVIAALGASTVGPLTCEDLAVELDATEKGVALTMSGLSRRGLVRWSWVQRGSGRARKGYSLVPDGAA